MIPKREEIYETALGFAVGCSRIGESHKRSEMPCQDACSIGVGSVHGLPYMAVAVADGHGDKRHDLSQYGSSLAVKAAIDELSLLFNGHANIEGIPSSLSNSFKTDFPRLIGRRWRKYVDEDVKCRASEDLSTGDDRNKLFSRYGTTLLAALVTSENILLGQIGDGDILLLRPNGDIECPIEKDASLVGSITHSLSSIDAQMFWQTTVLKRDGGGLLLMATDGLSTAFADDTQFYTFSKSLLERIREFGIQKVTDSIPQWLDSYSENGSGDDITLSLISISPESTYLPAEEAQAV